MSRGIKFALGIAISAVCVWWAMREVRLAEVVAALRQASGMGFAALMVLTLIAFALRALRWRWLISSPQPIGFGSLYRATMVGFMANNLFPLRLGEFIRAWVLGRSEKLSKTTVFATVVVERVVDMITLLAIFGLALLLHPIGSETEAGRLTNAGAVVLMGLCVGLTAFLIAIERSPRFMHAFIDKAGAWLPAHARQKGVHALERFIEGLSLFRDLPRLAWVFLLSFVMFGVFALCLTVSMAAMHLDVPWYAGLVMLVITAIGIMVPAAPGYLGTLNLACVAGLALFAVGKDQAVPFSWFFWAGQWIPITLVGLLCLRKEGLSLSTIGHAQDGGA